MASPREIARAVTHLPRVSAPGGGELGEVLQALGALRAELLLDEAVLSFDDRGRCTTALHQVVRVVPAPGDELRAYSAFWRPALQPRPSLRVRVIHPDGTADAPGPASVEELPGAPDRAAAAVGGWWQLRVPLPTVRPGDVVEAETITRDPEEPAGVGRMCGHVLPPGARLARVRAEAPASLPLVHALTGGAGRTPRRRAAGGRRVLEWELRPVPPGGGESIAVSVSTWQGVSAALSDAVDRQLAGSTVVGRARELAEGAEGPDVAQRLLGWIGAHVRADPLPHGDGFTPDRPDDVVARGEGDCMDLSALLVGMLRAAGQPAEVVLVRAHGQMAGVPGVNQFDHAVVRLPGPPEVWMDPSFPAVPPGRLPPEIRGVPALVVSPDTAGPVRTPAP